MRTRTDWTLVALLLAAGVIAALQIGRSAIAVPLLREDLHVGLLAASWVYGAYGAIGATIGLGAGLGVSLIGARRATLGGLVAIAAGSALGAAAPDIYLLLATRVLESCGFLAISIALPTLVRDAAVGRDRDLVMVIWGAYMPAGMAAMMLLGPLAASLGWRMLWIVNAVLVALIVPAVWRWAPADPPRLQVDLRAVALQARGNAVAVLCTPAAVLLAVTFLLYSLQYGAMAGLLPSYLVDHAGLGIAQAGSIGAIAVVANACGNLAAGIFVRLRVPIWLVIAVAFTGMAVAAAAVFAPALPVAAVAALAAASLGMIGLIPASIFTAAQRVSPSQEMLAVTFGLIAQASHLGLLIGPAMFAAGIERFGWVAAPDLFLGAGAVGIAVALMLRRLLRPVAAR